MIVHDCVQGSEAWFKVRAGIPTGSEFSKLVTSGASGPPKRSKSFGEYAAVLAAEAYAGKPVDGFEGNKYTDRGKELEADARTLYEFEHSCEVQQVGFITDDLKRYGVSPDGLVGDDGEVEFKCLIAKRHIAVLLYFKKHGRCQPEYVAQTQGEMFLPKRAWNDLVFFHPDLPSITIRQTPDPVFVAELVKQLAAVEAERNLILATLRSF